MPSHRKWFELDLTNSQYFEQLGSIVRGLSKYKGELALSGGNVELTYFNNLRWNGKTLVEVDKPGEVRDFSSFQKYHDFLLSSLDRISENMSAKGRRPPTKC